MKRICIFPGCDIIVAIKPNSKRYVCGLHGSTYRAKWLEMVESHTQEEWESVKSAQDNKCIRCGELKPLEKDHIISIVKGGSNSISNIQGLCHSCNSSKNCH